MRDRFRRAIQEGDLDSGNNPDDLARYIMTVSEGLAVHAAEDLARTVDLALRAFAWSVGERGQQ